MLFFYNLSARPASMTDDILAMAKFTWLFKVRIATEHRVHGKFTFFTKFMWPVSQHMYIMFVVMRSCSCQQIQKFQVKRKTNASFTAIKTEKNVFTLPALIWLVFPNVWNITQHRTPNPDQNSWCNHTMCFPGNLQENSRNIFFLSGGVKLNSSTVLF